MGTGGQRVGTAKQAKRAGRASTAADLAMRPPLSADDLAAAARTLLIMADCHGRRRPESGGSADGGGIDRIQESSLGKAVQALKEAAGRQAGHGAVRTATVQLYDSLHAALARQVGNLPPARTGPKVRQNLFAPPPATGPRFEEPALEDKAPTDAEAARKPKKADAETARKPKKADAETALKPKKADARTLDRELRLALSEYRLTAGAAIPHQNRVKAMAAMIEKVNRYLDVPLGAEPPGPIAQEATSMLTGHPAETVRKWALVRRSEPNKAPLFGEPGAYFGATFERTDTETQHLRLCTPIGGDQFVRSAAQQLGVEEVLRLAVACYEQSNRMDVPAEVLAQGDPAATAQKQAIHAAVAQLAVALGGKDDCYDLGLCDQDGRRYRNDGTVWHPEDFDGGDRLVAAARGGWEQTWLGPAQRRQARQA